jgi:thiamine pyrophosphokinase
MRCCAVQASRPLRALVIADGDVPKADALPADLRDGDDDLLVIAADGGLLKARAMGLRPALVVGDGDSLASAVLQELASDGVEVQLHPRAKDQSDTELAVREAVRRGAREVVVIGALGGMRFDHSLANVLLLSSTDIDAKLVLVDGDSSVRTIGRRGAERIEVVGRPGDVVSLLPLSDEVTGVSTTGLAYPLDAATLRQGPTVGLSNELVSARGTVSVDGGRLAVIHTRSGGDR